MNMRPLIALLLSAPFLSQAPPSLSQTPPKASARASGLRRQIELISSSARGRVGAAVMLLETGEAVDFNGDGPFPMQSVYKLPIAMTVLRRVDEGALALDEKVRVEAGDLLPRK